MYNRKKKSWITVKFSYYDKLPVIFRQIFNDFSTRILRKREDVSEEANFQRMSL